MIIYINSCKTKGVLGSWKLWFSYINGNKKNQNQNFGSFLADFWFRAEWIKVTSPAEPCWKSFSLSYGSSQLGSDSSLLFSYINENENKIKIIGSFSADFRFRAGGKKVTSWAESSWKSFSSSSGSSQLGSDSSLVISDFKIFQLRPCPQWTTLLMIFTDQDMFRNIIDQIY